MKKALIFGVLGQDGSYLAELLFEKGYKVYGVIKENTDKIRMAWLKSLVPDITFCQINVLDKGLVAQLINKIFPDEIYNFSAVSDVFSPWDNSDIVLKLNGQLPVYILDAIRQVNTSIRFFQASSCLIYGNDLGGYINEETPTNPLYPYGCAKLYADNMIKEYRREFNIFACSGIFGSHESPRRKANFFTKKVSNFAKSVKSGNKEKLMVGNLLQKRDVGYAPDYMRAAYLMLQSNSPKDYIISTNILTTNEDFINLCFQYIMYNYKNHIEVDDLLKRNEIMPLELDNSKIWHDLGWAPGHNLEDIVKIMMESE